MVNRLSIADCRLFMIREVKLYRFYSSLRKTILTVKIPISKRVIPVDQPESGIAGGPPVPNVQGGELVFNSQVSMG